MENEFLPALKTFAGAVTSNFIIVGSLATRELTGFGLPVTDIDLIIPKSETEAIKKIGLLETASNQKAEGYRDDRKYFGFKFWDKHFDVWVVPNLPVEYAEKNGFKYGLLNDTLNYKMPYGRVKDYQYTNALIGELIRKREIPR